MLFFVCVQRYTIILASLSRFTKTYPKDIRQSQPSRHREHPKAVFPLITWPCPHLGHTSPSFTFKPVAADCLALSAFFFGLATRFPDADLPAAFPLPFVSVGLVSGPTPSICRLLLSCNTSCTMFVTCSFSSLINCSGLYRRASMSRSFFSQIPVSSQLVSNRSCMVSTN